jgi:class 3 adenylate cyclase/tetratricopeptide (TPR) repeat protein
MADFDVSAFQPRVLLARPPDAPRHWRTEGSLVLLDISGFTQLSDQLARRGREGAEDLIATLVRTFTLLLAASDDGGDVLKFGGDALLISYTGPEHERRACHAAHMMQRVMRVVGNVQLTGARARLRTSVGIHSGTIDYLLPGIEHQDLVVTGAGVTKVIAMESAADAGEILLSPVTARKLPNSYLGARKGGGTLLRRVAPMPSTGSQILFRSQDEAQIWRHMPSVFRARPDLLHSGSDHRRAAMAFVHITGIDEMVARDPVETLSRMDHLATLVEEAAAETGVSILDADIGADGYKYFLAAGAPASLEDPEGRMLRALLRITLTETGLSVRAGCAVGRVFAGIVGAPFRCTYAAMGDTTNLAARLCAEAPPGGVLAHAPLVASSLTAFAHSEREELTIKGKPDPVPVVQVTDLLGRRGRPLADVPFVGRKEDLGKVTESVRTATTGHGVVVEIIGEAGLGKSRLATAALAHTGLPEMLISTDPYGGLVPYQTLRSVLRRLMGIPTNCLPGDAGELLTQFVTAAIPDMVPWLPLVARVVGADVASTRSVDELDQRFRTPQLHDAIRELLTALMPDPIALLFDDAQWVDESSAEALTYAFSDVSTNPWAIVLTRREGDEGLHGSDAMPTVELRLAPLASEEASTLVSRQTLLRPDEIEAIVSRGGGNPYFLLQLAENHSEGDLPETVEELVGTRIDDLGATERQLLRKAAVLGSRFHVDLYERATGDHSFHDAVRDPAVAAYLGIDQEGMVAFDREIYREVAYGQLTFRARKQLHQQAAQAIEKSPELAGEEKLSMLSLHYFRAGIWQLAYRTSLDAGDLAKRDYANDEAVEFYRRALIAGRRAGASRDHLRGLVESMGDVEHVAGRFSEALKEYRTALRTATDPRDKIRVILKVGRVLDQSGRFPGAIRLYRDARRHTEGLPPADVSMTLAEIDVSDAASHYFRGRLAEARDLAERAWTRAVDLPDEERVMRVRARAAFMYDSAAGLIDGPKGLRFRDMPLEMYRDMDDHYYAGIVSNNLGLQAFNEGRWAEAAELYTSGRELSMRAGDRVSACFMSMNLAEILGLHGRVEDAEELLEQAMQTFTALDVTVGMAATGCIQAALLLRQGEVEQARQLLEEARAVSIAMDSQQDLDEVEVLELQALLTTGSYGEVIAGATALADRTPALDPIHAARTRRLLGTAHLHSGDTERGTLHLEESLRVATEMEAGYEMALALEELGTLGGPEAAARQAQAEELVTRLGIVRQPQSVSHFG